MAGVTGQCRERRFATIHLCTPVAVVAPEFEKKKNRPDASFSFLAQICSHSNFRIEKTDAASYILGMNNKTEINDAMHDLLRAAGELSVAQARLDQQPNFTMAHRDHAARKVCDAFRRFEAGAKAIREPVTVSMNLSPSA